MRTRIAAINVIGCEAADEQIHSRSVFSHQQINQVAVRRELVFDKFKQIAARGFGNIACHALRVARCRKIDDEDVRTFFNRRLLRRIGSAIDEAVFGKICVDCLRYARTDE